MKHNSKNLFSYAAIHVLMLLYSLMPVCLKIAGRYPVFSWGLLIYYGAVLLLLGIYAIGWQQIIKHMPLAQAYANKAITVVWGILWGYLIFQEKISLQMLIGASIIIAGVIIYAFSGDHADA